MLLVTGGALLSGGCMRADRNTKPIALNPLPLKEDEAIARRNWELQPVWYTNVGAVGGPTGQTWVPSGNYANDKPVPGPAHIVSDDVIFVGNAVLMPIRLIIQPPWTEKVYRGVTVPPTYTASPPLEATTDATR